MIVCIKLEFCLETAAGEKTILTSSVYFHAYHIYKKYITLVWTHAYNLMPHRNCGRKLKAKKSWLIVAKK